MTAAATTSFEPLADQAVMARCPDEASAFAFAQSVRQRSFPWVEDVVQAYTSVAVFLRGGAIDFQAAIDQLSALPVQPIASSMGTLHRIPCCYDLGLDHERISQHTGLSHDQIVALHTSTIYTVYAIGFCPGFPYLGYLPKELTGVPRLESPRLKVEAGSVGLTGRQTGIYTEARPGGWNIVGRTPLELVNAADAYFPIRTGDRVRFEAIDERKYRKLSGKRLPV